ncbi:hypothetical protein [Streptomyces silaceus]|uniref:hypothetical protein n=1 Tax=Streptomyces silaceus TaxID=545123 RepID=UPI0006EB7D65|nr:hypothetical protein [Streptomyces silaceus]
MSNDRAAELPSPEVLWHRAATLAAWGTEQVLPEHNYAVDSVGVRSEDVGNGWWALSWVEGGRAVMYGLDNDYSDTISLSPPLDLLAGGPAWLPWPWLERLITTEVVGFVYWWDGGAWAHAPYPPEAHDDGVGSIVPVDDDPVEQVCAALVDDGADPARVADSRAAHGRAAAASFADRPVLPAGQGEPSDRRVPCDLPEQHAAVLAAGMRGAAERDRAEPPGGAAQRERLVEWVRDHGVPEEGRTVLAAAFVDSRDPHYGQGQDGFQDVLRRRLFGEVLELLTAVREAEADQESGRWLYMRVTVTEDGSTVERAYDCLPHWWPATRSLVAALPGTVRAEMAARAPAWRPEWAALADEGICRDGAPAALCRVDALPPFVRPKRPGR